MKNEGTKNVLLGVLIVGLVSMTVAFAALSTQLSINNTAEVAAQSWDVEFTKNNGTVVWERDDDSSDPSVTATDPTLTGTSITGAKFTFVKPGTSVKYNFGITNYGTIPAKNTGILKGTPTCYSDQAMQNNTTCPAMTFTVKCNNTALVNNTATNTVLNTNDSISCTYEVTLDAVADPAEGSNSNSYNQPAVYVDGLDVSWDWTQN